MRLVKVVCFLMLLGGSAAAAYSDPIDPASAFPDPNIVWNDPLCAAGAYCADLTYTGTTMTFCDGVIGLLNTPGCMTGNVSNPYNPLQFLVPDPPGPYPAFPNGPVYRCTTNVSPGFGVPIILPGLPIEFNGCDFFGTVTSGEMFTISALGGPVELSLPTDFSCQSSCSDGNINLTPEPGSAPLCVAGLVCLLGFGRKRFGAYFFT